MVVAVKAAATAADLVVRVVKVVAIVMVGTLTMITPMTITPMMSIAMMSIAAEKNTAGLAVVREAMELCQVKPVNSQANLVGRDQSGRRRVFRQTSNSVG